MLNPLTYIFVCTLSIRYLNQIVETTLTLFSTLLSFVVFAHHLGTDGEFSMSPRSHLELVEFMLEFADDRVFTRSFCRFQIGLLFIYPLHQQSEELMIEVEDKKS